jgi:phosphate transport system permease protein
MVAAKREPHPPARTRNLGDRVFGTITLAFGVFILAILVGMLLILVSQAKDSITQFGLGFIYNSTWDSNRDLFGALPAILGTVYTAILALALAAPVGLLVAIFLTEMAPRRIRLWLGFVVELLAAVPSVVYGLWALVVLAPIVAQNVQPFINSHFANVGFLTGIPVGQNVFTACIILAVMVLPTITAISRDVMMAVPNSQRDAMLALGATRWETVWKAVVPYARSGIIGAIILALGRAVGETMAVQMVIGNTQLLPTSLFGPATTMTATLVNQFPEASGGVFRGALLELALVLMVITFALNGLARILVWRVATPQ